MGKFIDLTGQIFGDLTVIERDTTVAAREAYWKCRCSCGNIISTRGSTLRGGKATSCGCMSGKKAGEKMTKDLTGQTFGELTVLQKDETNTQKGAFWICKCSCGTIKTISGSSLRRGATKSCGCKSALFASQKHYKEDLSGETFGRWQVIKRDEENHLGQGAYWLCQCSCGTAKSVRETNLKNGKSLSCGCLQSRGEWLISNCLKELGYDYKSQYSFPELLGDYLPLRFDFAIFDNDTILALIEYQGEQHYQNREFFETHQSFEKRQGYDQRKRDYCKNNNLTLIEIPYWDYNKINKEYISHLIK